MKFYELVKEPLGEIEKYMEKVLSPEDSYMYPLLLEYLKRGGKRLRPVLVLLSLGALKGDLKEGIKPSAILEMFHNFTLVHDDIEDNSLMRRGKPTMHISQTLPIAINAGDALYTIVWHSLFNLNIEAEKKNKIGLLLSNAFKRVVEGQAIELKWYRDKVTDITEEEYFSMIEGKTGSLMQASCELGAILSPNSKLRTEIGEFGRTIGIAFQIQDDILNLIGDEKKYKKEIGGDITEGKRTLMFVHALNNLKEKEKKELEKIILSNTKEKSKIERAIELLRDSKGIEHAQEEASSLIKKAKDSLDILEDSKYKEALLDLPDFIIKRAH